MDLISTGMKRAITTTSVAVFVFGTGSLIASVIVIYNAGSNYYGGSWYVGMACIFAGMQGLRFGTTVVNYTNAHVKWVSISAAFAAVFAISGSTNDGAAYDFVSSLKACAAASDREGNCDWNGWNSTCYGNSDYFQSAAQCEFTNQMYDCVCVASNDGTCFGLNGYRSCAFILDTFPKEVQSSYAMCMFCLFSSLFMSLLSMRLCWRGNQRSGNDLQRPVNEGDPYDVDYHLFTRRSFGAPTVVMASAEPSDQYVPAEATVAHVSMPHTLEVGDAAFENTPTVVTVTAVPVNKV